MTSTFSTFSEFSLKPCVWLTEWMLCVCCGNGGLQWHTQRWGPGVVHVWKQRGVGTLPVWHDLVGGVWGFWNKMAVSQSCWKDWPTQFQKSSGEACWLEQRWHWGDSETLLHNFFNLFLHCSRRREQYGLGRQHSRVGIYCTGPEFQLSAPN